MVLADVILEKPKSDFSNPMYHELAVLNGEINKLDDEQLNHALTAFGLDSRGCFGVRQKRLKSYVRAKKQELAGLKSSNANHFDFLVFIDFEATCHEQNPTGFLHEIIEFPMILYDCLNRRVISEFHEYVKPRINPALSSFCKELTGIEQELVDRADTFVSVFERAQNWLHSKGLFEPGVRFAIATDGPWDICRFLVQQCMIDRICLPFWASRWLNVRKIFTNYYKLKYYPKLPDLEGMLEALGLTFEGHPHFGLADARNCARIFTVLLEDLCCPDFNEFLDKYGYNWLLEPDSDNDQVISTTRLKCLKWRTPQKNQANENGFTNSNEKVELCYASSTDDSSSSSPPASQTRKCLKTLTYDTVALAEKLSSLEIQNEKPRVPQGVKNFNSNSVINSVLRDIDEIGDTEIPLSSKPIASNATSYSLPKTTEPSATTAAVIANSGKDCKKGVGANKSKASSARESKNNIADTVIRNKPKATDEWVTVQKKSTPSRKY